MIAALSRLLAGLAALDLRATFFLEGWSTALYADAMRVIALSGHEIVLYGRRHENWAAPDPRNKKAMLKLRRDAAVPCRLLGYVATIAGRTA